MDDLRTTIARVAREEGVDPAYALAERESSFNPNAHASKTIYGLFQMNAGERAKYGAGNSSDPETQTRAFAGYTRDLQGEMTRQMGRTPTNNETYLGHFWGGPRASRTISGAQAGLSPQDMFTRQELAENPELARGSSAGGLASNIMADIGRRQAKFGGDSGPSGTTPVSTDFSAFGQPLDEASGTQVASNGVDFAQFGRAADGETASSTKRDQVSGGTSGASTDDGAAARAQDKQTQAPQSPGSEVDLSQYGIAAGQPAQHVAFGYDATADEMGSGIPINPAPKDQGILQQSPGGAGQPMERDPALIPKAPLQQVPEENLDPNRPDFFKRQFDVNAQPPDFSQFGTPPPTAQV